MRTESILGWICLFLAFGFYHFDEPTSSTGRFINAMAIGFFIGDIIKYFINKNKEG